MTLKTFILSILFITTTSFASITVIHNANIYSLIGEELVKFEALAFEEGIILKTGTNTDVVDSYPESIKINAEGQTILPGLHDSHMHIFQAARRHREIDLTGVVNDAQLKEKISQFINSRAKQAWYVAHNWDMKKWQGSKPHLSFLDEISTTGPIIVTSTDKQTIWVNSRAFIYAKAYKTIENSPHKNLIEKDENGNRTGILTGPAITTITSLTLNKVLFSSEGEISVYLKDLLKLGLTNVEDIDVDYRSFLTLRKMNYQKTLPLRVSLYTFFATKKFNKILELAKRKHKDNMLKTNGISFTLDKELYEYNAALLKPYSDNPATQGKILQSDVHINDFINSNLDGGWQYTFNATGDLANKVGLDYLLSDNLKNSPQRHRLEKAKILDFKDIKRLKNQDVIISIQPQIMNREKVYAQDRIGRNRLRGAYAWKTLLNTGAKLISGSGAPNADPNPFWGIHTLVNRTSPESDEKSWIGVEKLSVEQAFASYTTNPAYAKHQDDVSGSLETGKWADFIVIDQDIFTIPPKNIWKTQVLQTWVDGKKVFQKRQP